MHFNYANEKRNKNFKATHAVIFMIFFCYLFKPLVLSFSPPLENINARTRQNRTKCKSTPERINNFFFEINITQSSESEAK